VSASRRYAVHYDPRAVRELTKLDGQIGRSIAGAVARLWANPRPAGSRVLAGFPNLWRIRIGDYRVIYTIKDAELIVLALRIAHRSIYRNL
jgi:mRNA interferase RelE/StbE